MKTAYRTNIYASIAFNDLIIKRDTARYETTSRHCFLDEHELKTKCEYRKQVVLSSVSEKELHIFFLFNEKNKIIIKRFYNSTLAVIELLKRTNMSYLKYR